MRDFRLRNLERLATGRRGDHLDLSIPLPSSESGKVRRRCPNEDCTPALFMLGPSPDHRLVAADYPYPVPRLPGEESETCPYCGTTASSDDFYDQGDIDDVQDYVAQLAERDVAEALNEMMGSIFGRSSSRSSRSGGISITTSFKPGRLPPMPRLPYREDLLRSLECDYCGCPYGVYAVGLFCPDCGAPNLHVHFRREIEIVQREIAVAQASEGEHGSEVAYRLLGNAHEDMVTAFEAYQKVMYTYVRKARGLEPKVVKNDFQNVQKAQRRWSGVGLDPHGRMSGEELAAVDRFIQKRHVIGHNLGLADDKLASVESDVEPGETVNVLAAEIVEFAHTCERLLEGLCDLVFDAPENVEEAS